MGSVRNNRNRSRFIRKAIQKFDDIEINGEGHVLPLENYYIDGSFNREEDEEVIREYYMQQKRGHIKIKLVAVRNHRLINNNI